MGELVGGGECRAPTGQKEESEVKVLISPVSPVGGCRLAAPSTDCPDPVLGAKRSKAVPPLTSSAPLLWLFNNHFMLL